MKTVLIVCGAGASSTFLASRMRALAKQRNLPLAVEAASDLGLDSRLAHVHVLLVGPHLATSYESLRAQAEEFQVHAALLPSTAFGPGGAEQAFDLVTSLLSSRENDHQPQTEGTSHA